MDLATLIGILLGILLIGITIIWGGSPDTYIHLPALLIVMGGSMAATLISFKFSELIGVLGVVKKAFQKEKSSVFEVVHFLTELSKKARKQGLIAIDRDISTISDRFLRSGLEMAIDGSESETIRNIMETELSYVRERHKKGQKIFSTLGTYSPAFGMIGTLIGLIAMLHNLDDPSQIGRGMAVALTTTFYGVLMANLIFLPIAEKLRNRSESEIVLKEMIIEGVLSIQYGEHPNNINRKLLNFIPPKERQNNLNESKHLKAG